MDDLESEDLDDPMCTALPPFSRSVMVRITFPCFVGTTNNEGLHYLYRDDDEDDLYREGYLGDLDRQYDLDDLDI